MTTPSEMQYLVGSVAQALQKGLSEVILKKPHDPIEYLATWLYAYQGTTRADREEALLVQKEVKAEKAKRQEEAEHEQLSAEKDNVAAEEAALNLSLQQAAEHAAHKDVPPHQSVTDFPSVFDNVQESTTHVELDTEQATEAADLEQQQEQLDADEPLQDTDLGEAQAFDDQLQLTARSDNAEDQQLQEESAQTPEAAEAQPEEDDTQDLASEQPTARTDDPTD